jgi:hypothetical protein
MQPVDNQFRVFRGLRISGSSGFFWCFLIGVLRAIRKETVLKQSYKAAN